MWERGKRKGKLKIYYNWLNLYFSVATGAVAPKYPISAHQADDRPPAVVTHLTSIQQPKVMMQTYFDVTRKYIKEH